MLSSDILIFTTAPETFWNDIDFDSAGYAPVHSIRDGEMEDMAVQKSGPDRPVEDPLFRVQSRSDRQALRLIGPPPDDPISTLRFEDNLQPLQLLGLHPPRPFNL